MKRDSLRILTIGNSFTDSLAQYFPQVAASGGMRPCFRTRELRRLRTRTALELHRSRGENADLPDLPRRRHETARPSRQRLGYCDDPAGEPHELAARVVPAVCDEYPRLHPAVRAAGRSRDSADLGLPRRSPVPAARQRLGNRPGRNVRSAHRELPRACEKAQSANHPDRLCRTAVARGGREAVRELRSGAARNAALAGPAAAGRATWSASAITGRIWKAANSDSGAT